MIINHRHEGLIFESDIFGKLNIGEKVKAYVKKIRDDNKIDIALQPIGFENFNDPNCEMILSKLAANKGFLPITDKSTPGEVYDQFNISKKAYKKAIGTLYKQRKIVIQADGIKML